MPAYRNRKQGDYVPVEGKSNFYLDPLDKQTYQKGLDIFASVPEDSNNPVINANQFLDGYTGQNGAITINNYYGDGTETQQKKSNDFTSSLLTKLVLQQSKGQMEDPLRLMLNQLTIPGEGSGKLNPLSVFGLLK